MDEKNEDAEKQTEVATPSKETAPEETKKDTGNIEYASFIERFLAILIDAIIFGFIFGVFFSLFQNLMPGLNENLGFAYNPLAAILMWAYFIYMDVKYGATLGKRAMKLRVQNLDNGQNLSTVDAILRETVGRFLSGILFIGYLWMLWDDKKQCWHDKLGKSIVVKVK